MNRQSRLERRDAGILLLSYWQIRNGVLSIFRNVWLTLLLLVIGGGTIWGVVRLPLLFTRIGANSLEDVYLRPYLAQMEAGIFATLIGLGGLSSLPLFNGAALQFSLPDVYYLFPSPLSRRLVLASKLPGQMLGLAGTTLTCYSLYYLLIFGPI